MFTEKKKMFCRVFDRFMDRNSSFILIDHWKWNGTWRIQYSLNGTSDPSALIIRMKQLASSHFSKMINWLQPWGAKLEEHTATHHCQPWAGPEAQRITPRNISSISRESRYGALRIRYGIFLSQFKFFCHSESWRSSVPQPRTISGSCERLKLWNRCPAHSW